MTGEHAVVVKLYHPCTQFLRNVRLSHRRIATFSAHHDLIIVMPSKYSYLLTYLLTYLLMSLLLINIIVKKTVFYNNG